MNLTRRSFLTLAARGVAVAAVALHLPWVSAFAAPKEARPLPLGWLECNGQSISSDQYPELADVIGESQTGVFELPDMWDEHLMRYIIKAKFDLAPGTIHPPIGSIMTWVD